VLVRVEVDAAALELDAFHLQAQPLLVSRIMAEPDAAIGAENSVPGEPVSAPAQELGYQAVVERVSGSGRDGGVRRHLSLRNGPDRSLDRLVA